VLVVILAAGQYVGAVVYALLWIVAEVAMWRAPYNP